MLINRNEKHQLKKDLKWRMITLALSIPFGAGFAVLFYWAGLNIGLQIFLTVLCWGAVYLGILLICSAIKKQIAIRNMNKPKKKDPFAD